MESASQPTADEEIFDLDAIAALKESAAVELKEQGNEYVKKGKKHYADAIDCYTRAINQKALNDTETSILYSNRAHANLLVGNFRRALNDAEEAIKLNPSNVKAFYRALKASLSLNLLDGAKSYCEKGLEKSPDNEELKKLLKQINAKKSEIEQREIEMSKAIASANALISAFEDRQITCGKPMYEELTGVKKPTLDKSNILHWTVVLLYAEVMSSDIIEDFCETDMFSLHLDVMFSETSPPLPWDTKNAYTRDAIELYYEANSGVPLSKKDIYRHLLQGTVASHVEKFDDEEIDKARSRVYNNGDDIKWVRVNERRKLHDVLKSSDLIVPGIPVFFVVSTKSSIFYRDFKSGKWVPPATKGLG